MLDPEIVEKLKLRYSNIHPLLFHRSTEYARSNGDLFDILDSIPEKYPLVWCEESFRWMTITDLYFSDEFFVELDKHSHSEGD